MAVLALSSVPSSCRDSVVVVEPAEHGDRNDLAGMREWNTFTGNGDELVEPLMRASPVEMISSEIVRAHEFSLWEVDSLTLRPHRSERFPRHTDR